ncbi:MAG: hypothetical protein ACI8V5_004438, partial [Limisphaerales bacterium]
PRTKTSRRSAIRFFILARVQKQVPERTSILPAVPVQRNHKIQKKISIRHSFAGAHLDYLKDGTPRTESLSDVETDAVLGVPYQYSEGITESPTSSVRRVNSKERDCVAPNSRKQDPRHP